MTDPIFIHSLFRAGSTYLFNCFRRSSFGYWCYQEPLNEYLINASDRPDKLLELHEENVTHLRHPGLERPYFYEFHFLAEQIGGAFKREFSYDDYFLNDLNSLKPLSDYLQLLVDGAQGYAVLQECRSCGRVDALRQSMGGKHLFLWRNPWDQWWSYKIDSHFDICNLQILVSRTAPDLFVELHEYLGVSVTIANETDFVSQRLDAAGSYMLFFALWCHAMLDARRVCDLDINIDSLSKRPEYRQSVLQQLKSLGVVGLNFDDCSIPISKYGKHDREFFNEIEERVIDLYLRHGYDQDEINEMQKSRNNHDYHQHGNKATNSFVSKELDRQRMISRRLESELASAQRELFGKENERKTLEDTLWSMEDERKKLADSLRVKEGECQKIEDSLWAKENERKMLKNSLWIEEEERKKLEDALRVNENELERLAKVLNEKEEETGVIATCYACVCATTKWIRRVLSLIIQRNSGG